MENQQWLRKTSLLVVEGDKALDLSEMHFRFQTTQDDAESPNTLQVRIYNLSEETVRKIRGEYSKVVLQAGYEHASFGIIFEGTIKQYRIGKEHDGLSTYLDILAADGDVAYNFAIVNGSYVGGTSATSRAKSAIDAMTKTGGVKAGDIQIPTTGGVLPRGKVLFGLARNALRNEAHNAGATWNISNGRVNITKLEGYLPGEAVVLTADTGLIGRVTQTEEGMRMTCLLNPKIVVGGLVKIDNRSINQTAAAKGQEIPGAQLAYNRYAGLQLFATVNSDGLYRVYVAEHTGDTRGNEYYTDIVALSVDPVTNKVKPYG